jgi:hypothetical protein
MPSNQMLEHTHLIKTFDKISLGYLLFTRLSATFEINFFKERRLRMSTALNSVKTFRHQNGDI